MVPASELPVMVIGQLQVIHSYILFSNGLECAWEKVMEASGSLLGIFIAVFHLFQQLHNSWLYVHIFICDDRVGWVSRKTLQADGHGHEKCGYSDQIGEVSTTFAHLPRGSLEKIVPVQVKKQVWWFCCHFFAKLPLHYGQGDVHVWWLGVYITNSAGCTCGALRCRTKLLFGNVWRQGCKRATQHGNKLHHGEQEVALEEFKLVFSLQ